MNFDEVRYLLDRLAELYPAWDPLAIIAGVQARGFEVIPWSGHSGFAIRRPGAEWPVGLIEESKILAAVRAELGAAA